MDGQQSVRAAGEASNVTPLQSRGPLPSAEPAPRMQIMADLGTWTFGQPIAAGSGRAKVLADIEDLARVVAELGVAGFQAFAAVVQHAQPAQDPEGNMRLELPGYSGAWLMEHAGLRRNEAYKASKALRAAGLVTVTSMPGARGAEGRQMAVVTNLVGISASTDDLVETKRGRRDSTTVPRSVSRKVGNRESDALPPSQDPGNRGEFPQVNTVSPKAGNRPSKVVSQVDSSTSLPSDDLAALGVDQQVGKQTERWAAEEMGLLCPGYAAFAELREALWSIERTSPGSVKAMLTPITMRRASEAGAVVRALALEGEDPVAVRCAGYLAEVLLSYGGSNAPVWQRLDTVKIFTDVAPTEVKAPRLVASVLVGFDSAVKDWKRWLSKGTRSSITRWGQHEALETFAAAVRTLLEGQPSGLDDEHEHSPKIPHSPTLGAGTDGPLPIAADLPPLEEYLAYERGPAPPGREPTESSPDTTPLLDARSEPPVTEPADPALAAQSEGCSVVPSGDGVNDEDLAAAVVWGVETGHLFARHGLQGLASRPAQAKALVHAWRDATGR